MITACLIDSREPKWVQELKFDGIPTSVLMLEVGDLHAVTDDGCVLVIERKTPDDFLNSLKNERLMPQIARMAELRLDEQLSGQITTWPYLVIIGELRRSPGGKVITDDRGPTGWDWAAIQGALLTIQETGVFVAFCSGDADYEDCIKRLGVRKRDGAMKLLPPRPPEILGPGAAFLASLPGVGIERVMELLKWSGNIPAHAIAGLTDLEVEVPGLPKATRKRIRQMLGLKDQQQIALWMNNQGDETLAVLEKIGG